MRLRQAVFVARDLEGSYAELHDLLGVDVAYRDPGVGKWGLENVVCASGSDFIEIVSPKQDGTSAGRYIERRHGDGGYMVILQVPDAIPHRARVLAGGARAVAQKDLPEYRYTHFHPADTSGVLLSIDSVVPPPGADPALFWPPASAGWQPHRRDDMTSGLAGIELQHTDHVAMAEHWSKLLDRPVERSGATLTIRMDNGPMRFVAAADGRGPGISAYDVKATDRARVLAAAEKRGKRRSDTQVEVCGCRVNLV
ncbi:MAG: VOC family protein [Rhodospirillales bacterium]|nr:MAG: VOC family protein [Rhodospirillales bacterium]